MLIEESGSVWDASPGSAPGRLHQLGGDLRLTHLGGTTGRRQSSSDRSHWAMSSRRKFRDSANLHSTDGIRVENRR
jgi:hypothetical protein